ncbi:MAG: hypothetical protein Q8Q14_11500 [Gemmatimonadales bacterium]|nr:hypothetical protein [Gemmatimonadales bacterium]
MSISRIDAEALRHWWEGHTVDGVPPKMADAARKFGVCDATLRKHRRLAGLSARAPRRPPQPAPEWWRDLERWWRAGLERGEEPAAAAAARVFRRSVEGVRQAAIALGLPVRGSTPHLTHAQRAALEAWWRERVERDEAPALLDAAAAFGVSYGVVYRVIRAAELPRRPVGAVSVGRGAISRIEFAAWWRGYMECGEAPTTGEAGEAFGLTRQRAHQLAVELGLPRRSR